MTEFESSAVIALTRRWTLQLQRSPTRGNTTYRRPLHHGGDEFDWLSSLVAALKVQGLAVLNVFGLTVPGALIVWGYIELMNAVSDREWMGIYVDPAAAGVVPYTYALVFTIGIQTSLLMRGWYGILIFLSLSSAVLAGHIVLFLIVARITVAWSRVTMLFTMMVVNVAYQVSSAVVFRDMLDPNFFPASLSGERSWPRPKIKFKDVKNLINVAISAVLVGYYGCVATQFGSNSIVRAILDFLAGIMQIFVLDALSVLNVEIYTRLGFATKDEFDLMEKCVTIASCQANVKMMRYLELFKGLQDTTKAEIYWTYSLVSITLERILPRVSGLISRAMLRREMRLKSSVAPDSSDPTVVALPPPSDIQDEPSEPGPPAKHPPTPGAPPTAEQLSHAEHLLQVALRKLEEFYSCRRNDHALASYLSTAIAAVAVCAVSRSAGLAAQVERFRYADVAAVVTANLALGFMVEVALVLAEKKYGGVKVGKPQSLRLFLVLGLATLFPVLFFTAFEGTHCIYRRVDEGKRFTTCTDW
ncbi:hypothetical protein HDU96_000331 [Phlyctochytrium bullatum]|nr:hypothetical protein HDU96_000331 [Phlyctochytrium bullatum]